MGRVRIQLEKIENKTYRHITFAKRKSGLVKKAYELSTLCDVEVALIIFSPAGKLFLFDGKKRLEEIFMHYIDLPLHQRGRLRDQELIRRIIAQLSLEAELHHQLRAASYGDRESKMRFDSQLEEIQNEIRMCSAELEHVEKQLQYFLKSPSSIKSAGEAEFVEGILEETLKLVRIHKKDLEAKNSIQLNSEQQRVHVHLQTADGSSFIIESSNCGLNWSQQYDTRVVTANNFSNSIEYQPLRNHSQPLAHGVAQSSLPNVCGSGNPAGHSLLCSSSRSEFDGFICQLPAYDKLFNAQFPSRLNDVQQGRTNANTEQNKVVGDGTVACRGSSSQVTPFPS